MEVSLDTHPGVELRANLKSISHRCHLFEVAFVWELTKETIHLPLGCLQGGSDVKNVQMHRGVQMTPLPTLEATQGQFEGFFSQLPYKCHQNRVASVGD